MVEENLQRGITEKFEQQLLSGILLPILQRVRHDDTISLEIRNGYVDIYYRGGRLLGLHEQVGATRFRTEFHPAYLEPVTECPLTLPPTPPKIIGSREDALAWVDALAVYKQAMDIRFMRHAKIEREYQQAVVRDNNRHISGDQSDYMVVDIEYAQSPAAFPEQNADYRFDMVGFRWPVKGRDSNLVVPVIMEMKAGDGALASGADSTGKQSPGLAKHVLDFERFLEPEPDGSPSARYQILCAEMQRIYATKHRLDLNFAPTRMRKRWSTVEVDLSARPDVLFVIANHQPTSALLKRELEALPARERANYYMASVQFAGYAFFKKNLLTLEEAIGALG